MEELIDLIATDGKPSEVSEKIKELLYAKSAEKVNSVRPEVAALMFNNEEQYGDEG
jgi:hypothetical protein